MPATWNRLERKRKIILSLSAFLVAVAAIVWSVYWHDQWRMWKQANETILAYPLASAEAVKAREHLAKEWTAAPADMLPAVQKLADMHNIQLVSFYALNQDKGQYEIKLTSTYGNYIQFLNRLEQEIPFVSVSIVQMEYNGQGIDITMRI